MLCSLRLPTLIPGIAPTLGDIERPCIGDCLDPRIYPDDRYRLHPKSAMERYCCEMQSSGERQIDYTSDGLTNRGSSSSAGKS